MLLLNLHMHDIGYGAVGGIVEFMPDPFLKTYYPSLLATKMAAARLPGRAEKKIWTGARSTSDVTES